MPFVALGAPGIEVLRSPGQVREKVRSLADGLQSCEQWNYFFTEATGVEGPEVSQGCYVGHSRSEAVSLDDWFAWLEHQH